LFMHGLEHPQMSKIRDDYIVRGLNDVSARESSK
jgi:hypothetical protein